MNAAAATSDCHSTAENMKSIFMLSSCCTDTTILHQDGGNDKKSNRNRGVSGGGLLEDDANNMTADNYHRHGKEDTKQLSSTSSSRGGDFWTNASSSCKPSTRPMTSPTPKTNNSSNNNLPYSNSVPVFPDSRGKNSDTSNNNNNLGNTKPFASNPLIYRYDDDTDSVWDQSSGFFSLIASDAMDGGFAGNATVDAPSYAYCTPHRNNQQQRNQHHRQQEQQQRNPPTTADDDSPMIELSLAKQVANMAQMTNGNLRKTNREMLRNYRMMNHLDLGSSRTNNKDNNSSPPSPTKRTHESIVDSGGVGKSSGSSGSGSGDSGLGNHHHKKMAPMVTDEGGERSSSSVMDTDDDNTRPYYYYAEYINAPPTPVWSKVNATSTSTTTFPDIDSELLFTYMVPRLYLQDPIHIIEGIIHGQYNCDQIRELWWFHAAQRMETTLRHVQEDHWRALLSMTTMGDIAQSSMAYPNTTTKMKGSDSTNSFALSSDGCVSMKELCLGKQKQSHGGGDNSTSFSPSKTPTNVWSEPCASTMNVRGSSYSRDGIKVESETSIFSVLGVDSFVSWDKSAASGEVDSRQASTSGTASYLRRWKGICDEMGLHRPPFLLVINFIVPWGNFQAYLVRPDADEGPFSSGKRDHPSEKAWRKFMEGSTEYRNKRFKLVPRIVAGPWMVKKMVGSTPALIGTKLPMSYRGSVAENYLEIILDVTKGPAFGNSVASTVVGKADAVTVDLGFVIEGSEEDGHLPEQILGLFRLHHVDMKRAPTQSQWNK